MRTILNNNYFCVKILIITSEEDVRLFFFSWMFSPEIIKTGLNKNI